MNLSNRKFLFYFEFIKQKITVLLWIYQTENYCFIVNLSNRKLLFYYEFIKQKITVLLWIYQTQNYCFIMNLSNRKILFYCEFIKQKNTVLLHWFKSQDYRFKNYLKCRCKYWNLVKFFLPTKLWTCTKWWATNVDILSNELFNGKFVIQRWK